MGRYYCGDISGKFWFAIQDSLDASYYGVEPIDQYRFNDCGCQVESLEEKIYCSNCFDSYEDHIKESDNDKTYSLDNQVLYEFNMNNIEYLKKMIDKLDIKYNKYMTNFKIVDNGEIEYDYEPTDPKPRQNQLKFIARLCLGKQILYCLEKNESCTFYAEL